MSEGLTWKEAEPPALPAPTTAEVARGYVRIGLIVTLTVLGFILFLSGKLLQRLLGRWVGYHYVVARLWSRSVLSILGLKRVVKGAPIRKGGVLVSNHASWLDIVSLRSVTRVNFVSKAEVRKWPLVGYIAEVCETVFIERRRTAAKRQQEDLLARILNDELLCIFPEGTSTDGLRVLPFKSTLMSVLFLEGVHEHALVQPVSVVYRTNPNSELPVNFYGWWGTMSFEGHIWTLATRSLGGCVEIVFHEPMRAADWSDRKALTARCETDVRSAFK
ncbi:MAG: lysophospholipid acyltransferase family protein [Pseudomonadota bacterium]